jgi:ABC-type lipoprotein release transport system permease subunit
MKWPGGGVAVGLNGAFAPARLIAALVLEVHVRDPVTGAATGGVITLVAPAVAAIPAVRAVHVDPSRAIRNE